MSGPTDNGHILCEVVRGLTAEEQADLRDLLATELSVISPAGWREAKLGLVAELLYERGPEVSEGTYEEERAKREADGEEWPSASAAAERLGGWPCALAAGLALLEDRRRGYYDRTLIRYPGRGQSRGQVIEALIACYRTHGRWPDAWTYDKWAKLARDLAHLTGAPNPQAPALWWVKKAFGNNAGSYDRAITAAKRQLKTDRKRLRGSAREARLTKQGLL